MPRSDQSPLVSSASQSESPQPSNKRQRTRKAFRACTFCVSSKTRCEEVTSLGCSRCRARGKDCSLLHELSSGELMHPPTNGWSSTPHVSAHPYAGTGLIDQGGFAEVGRKLEAIDEAWRKVSQRLTLIEENLAAISSGTLRLPSLGQADLPHTHIPTPQPNNPLTPSSAPVPRPISGSAMHNAADAAMVHGPELLFTLVSMKEFPDVIKRGLMTENQVDMAFQMFKYRFSSMIPLPSYLLSSTPTPTDPFVILSILSHTSPSPPITALVEESILMTAAGANKPSIVLALLILSLCPLVDQGDRAPLTGFRCISLAYQAGLNLGLEVDTEVLLKRGKERLIERHWEETLEKVIIWELVKSRYNVLMLSHSRSVTMAPLHAAQLPDHPASHYTAAINHLRAESTLLQTVHPFASELSRGEVMWLSEMPELEGMIAGWQNVQAKLEAWRQTWKPSGVSRYDSQCISFVFGVRLSCLAQRSPSPIHPDRRLAGLYFTGVTLMQQAATLIVVFNSIPQRDLHQLPSYLIMIFCVSLIAARRCLTFIAKRHPDAHDSFIKEASLNEGEEHMRTLGGLASKALYFPDGFFGRPNQLPAGDEGAQSGEADTSMIPLDFDFSTLFASGLPDGSWDQVNLGLDWDGAYGSSSSWYGGAFQNTHM